MDSNNRLFAQLLARFDKVFVLTLSNRPERRDSIDTQFQMLGLPEIDSSNFIRYFYATPFPFNNILAEAMNQTKKGNFTKPNEFDCARNHYAMVRIAYDIGFEHVLILEDDILFRKDSDFIADYLNELPADYDIIQFGGFSADQRIIPMLDTKEKWIKHNPVGLWTTAGYALSRKGMEYYLMFMNTVLFWVADGPLYKAPLSHKIINTYMSNVPLVIQADKNDMPSDIRTKENDTIDYNNDNLYEKNIDHNDFFSLTEINMQH